MGFAKGGSSHGEGGELGGTWGRAGELKIFPEFPRVPFLSKAALVFVASPSAAGSLGEARKTELVQRQRGLAVDDQFAQQLADDGAEAEAVAAEAGC